MTSVQDLTWLVEERSKNQAFLLDLCQFGREMDAALFDAARMRTVFHLLVGTGFSLWRAVFLAERITDERDLLAKSQQFLETLLADNAIGYYQDKGMRTWSAGYYLNNAFFRVCEAIKELSDGGIRVDSIPEFVAFAEHDRRGTVSTDRRAAWEAAHLAASRVLSALRENRDALSSSAASGA